MNCNLNTPINIPINNMNNMSNNFNNFNKPQNFLNPGLNNMTNMSNNFNNFNKPQNFLNPGLNNMTNMSNNFTNFNNIVISNALTANSSRLNLTNNPFKVKLKPHQEALLYKVLDIDEKGSYSNMPYGVMSDKPGSGKTYVVLGLIYFAIKHLKSKGANIIVVPHNIYTQWVSSIEKLLGNKLTYKLLLEYSDINLLYTNPSMIYDNDIILTTSLYYDVFASTVKAMGLNVRRVFFDEADTIKNLLAHPMPCGITWFISASIKRVFDSKSNTAQIGSFKLHLNQLLANECYCLPEFVDSNIVLPKPNVELFKCRDFYIDNILSKILEREQLSYINGHDYSNIRVLCGNVPIKETKDIVENLYKNYVKILNDIMDQLKEIEKKLKYCMSDEKAKYQETKDNLLNQKIGYEVTTNKIKSLSSEYELCIKCFKKLKSKENINQNTFKLDYYELECNTCICNKCYTKEIDTELSINENTPIQKIKIKCLGCKNTHLVETLKYHTEDTVFNKKELELENMNKIIILEKILEIACNKIIIYSQFRGVSNYIKSIIATYKWGLVQLDGGNIKDLDNILDKFRNDPEIKILLIDDTSFGVGLNIEYATDIIFFNYIEPNVKDQLIGRAQRLGRTCKLNIWELLYTNEV
jgi:SNF2 family DNA or RNA helicase